MGEDGAVLFNAVLWGKFNSALLRFNFTAILNIAFGPKVGLLGCAEGAFVDNSPLAVNLYIARRGADVAGIAYA